MEETGCFATSGTLLCSSKFMGMSISVDCSQVRWTHSFEDLLTDRFSLWVDPTAASPTFFGEKTENMALDPDPTGLSKRQSEQLCHVKLAAYKMSKYSFI